MILFPKARNVWQHPQFSYYFTKCLRHLEYIVHHVPGNIFIVFINLDICCADNQTWNGMQRRHLNSIPFMTSFFCRYYQPWTNFTHWPNFWFEQGVSHRILYINRRSEVPFLQAKSFENFYSIKKKTPSPMLPFESLWKSLNLCKILKNDQTYFCGVNIATFLNYLWPFFNIMHERYTFHKFEI